MTAPVPVTIRGVLYPSRTDAARALSVSKSTLYTAARRGRLDFVALGPRARDPKPITIRGVRYPSRTAAAAALGLAVSTVCKAEKFGWLENVGLAGRKRGGRLRR